MAKVTNLALGLLCLLISCAASAQIPGPGPSNKGITELTGDCTAGPGAGSQVITCSKLSGAVLGSITLPTISSGFGTTPTAPLSTTSNGTYGFEITVGTGGTAATGVVGMPTITGIHGWACAINDKTTISASVQETKITAETLGPPSTITVGNFSDLAVATPWVAGDKLEFQCTPR